MHRFIQHIFPEWIVCANCWGWDLSSLLTFLIGTNILESLFHISKKFTLFFQIFFFILIWWLITMTKHYLYQLSISLWFTVVYLICYYHINLWNSFILEKPEKLLVLRTSAVYSVIQIPVILALKILDLLNQNKIMWIIGKYNIPQIQNFII
jgi:hypothetical protein